MICTTSSFCYLFEQLINFKYLLLVSVHAQEDQKLSPKMLTNDEAELYDRQIRLWGAHAQAKIRDSSVLMLGFTGVASEVAKTLVLAGIKSLTIVDDQPLQESDNTSNLFCRKPLKSDEDEPRYRTYAVRDKLKKLNPLVEVRIENSPIFSKKHICDETARYNLVTLHSFLTIEEIDQINTWCRSRSMMFYFAVDFGFYGFIFNDLCEEFCYEYEKFAEKSTDEVGKVVSQSKGDLISIDDDEDDASDDDNSIDGKSRPKKRRRIHSPERQSANKKSETQGKESQRAKLSYVTFNEMIKSTSISLDNKSSPVLIVSIAMIKFYNEKKHLPRQEKDGLNPKDLDELNRIIDSTCESLKVPEKLLKKLSISWTDHLTGNLSPICAVVGGLAGQDIIRVLSGKDIPIYNTFAFDGLAMNGSVTKVGFPEIKCDVQKPVIRDLVEIDLD